MKAYAHNYLIALTLSISPVVALFAEEQQHPTINRAGETLHVHLTPDVHLSFQLAGETMLGLATANVHGIATTAPDTLFRPYLAEDMFGQPHFTHALKLTSVETTDDSVVLHLAAQVTSDPAALERFYNMTPDPAAVADDDRPRALRVTSTAAEEALHLLIREQDPRTAKSYATWQKFQSQPFSTNPQELQVQRVRTKHFLQGYQAKKQKHHRIHTDYFGQAIPQLPAESAQQENLRALSAINGDHAGTLTWTFTRENVNIAGWDWQGWSHHISYEGLPDSPQFRVLRTQGTWELNGAAVGSTVVAMRYRGLGSIEETFEDDGTGGVDRCFTTTEIIPGAVGGVPVISPAVPASIEVGDRGYGMQHRLSPWIGVMARGGGANAVDFQYRPKAIYASYPVRQGNLRACTETFPGDRHISQRDEEWFAQGRRFTSTPFMHLVLRPNSAPFTRWQSITRWQEVDQHVRDQMSEELGMIQPEPLPAAGYNTDYNWDGRIPALAKQIESVLGPQGVRMILQHQPGWINGRAFGRKKDPRFAGGGDCTPYDFTAEGKTAAGWKDVSQACAKWDIDYYAWLSTIAHQAGQFALDVDAQQGGLQKSWGEIGNGKWTQSRILYAFDPQNSHFMQAFTQRMEDARNTWGYQGIWADSWQKWTTSFSGHAQGRPPLARDFWEMYAKWSHEGVALMSESTAFPGLSCSVELPNNNYDDEWWFAQHTVKWFRTHDRPPGFGTPAATEFTFRMHANKATICWNTEGESDLNEGVPEWSRLAHEYLAALPLMRRSWVLPDGAGVLWLGYDNDQEGVWYPFTESPIPAHVQASDILAENPVDRAKQFHVLKLTGPDLLEAFGLERGTLPDARIGRTYTPFVGATPAFLSELSHKN